MSRETGRMFLDRRMYRRRRVADAARLMPILGAVLFVLPLTWQGQEGAPVSTTGVMVYLFGIWAVLAVVSGLISRRLGEDVGSRPETGDGQR